MPLLDQQYVRRYRQHIPFYKSNFPQEDRRIYWHHRRCLCDPNCIFGIPVVEGQYLMFAIEDDAPTGLDVNIFNGGNSNITLCCLDEGDADACTAMNIGVSGQEAFATHKVCVIDGSPVQFNYFRFQMPNLGLCGIVYFKITAYAGTPNERIYYSQPIQTYTAAEASKKKLALLNINDTCGVGGIDWSNIWQGWGDPQFGDGYEVYLPEQVSVSFVEEVSEEEVEEDGKGNEIKIFEKTDWRYQFDTGFVPDHYAEIITELKHTDNNSVTVPDRQASHKFCIDRVESTTTPDGEGCYMNLNVNFLVNTYTSDACCEVQECECPEGNSAISYTTNQDVAETNPQEGDTYIVPNNGPAPNNPDWSTQDNRIAVWDGNDWVYTDNVAGSYYLVEDQADYFLSRGLGNVWEPEDAYIENVVNGPPFTCTYILTGVVPFNTFAKIQISPDGAGTWTDLNNGTYYSLAELLAGVTIPISTAGNWDLRLVHLDIGCGLENSPIHDFQTIDECA